MWHLSRGKKSWLGLRHLHRERERQRGRGMEAELSTSEEGKQSRYVKGTGYPIVVDTVKLEEKALGMCLFQMC